MRRQSYLSIIFKRLRYLPSSLFIFSALTLAACSMMSLNNEGDFDIVFKPTTALLVVVENRLVDPLQGELARYREDLAQAGIKTTVIGWQGTTAVELRDLIAGYHETEAIDGAFLVGNLPAAWYRAYAFGRYEEFPCDLFLMSRAAAWGDADGDGMYDSHAPLSLAVYVSRLIGTDGELIAYFDKVHRYRTGELRTPVKAYLYKDDDWYAYHTGSTLGLGRIYDAVTVREAPALTVRSVYVADMTGPGTEFVNQWIHSHPTVLAIYEKERDGYEYLSTTDIGAHDFNGLFYNLYNCTAARFTQENLGMSYLTRTGYGLAVFGSTKTGGSYYSLAFYDVLSKYGTWGDAFKNWYTYFGKNDDDWFLGMVILGDPALKVSAHGPTYRFLDFSIAPPPDATQRTEVKRVSVEFEINREFLGFREYRLLHPQYFRNEKPY